MKTTVLDATDPKLRKVCLEVSARQLRSRSTQALIQELLTFVRDRNNKGSSGDQNKIMVVGLSANQVGVLKRICVVDLAIGHREFSDIHVLINPKVVWHSKSIVTDREACANLPGICGIVPRYEEVRVEALDRSGNEITIKARGWASRLLQHEIDHLGGKLFIDRLPDPKKAHLVGENKMAQYRKGFRKWRRFVDVTDLI